MLNLHFLAFILASFIAFVAILRVAVRREPARAVPAKVAAVACVVVVGGMLFAKWGANVGLPWAIYYGLPAASIITAP